MWERIDRDAVDFTGAVVFVESGRVIAGGRWHVLTDGRILHETEDGNLQLSVHTVDALNDAGRFTRV